MISIFHHMPSGLKLVCSLINPLCVKFFLNVLLFRCEVWVLDIGVRLEWLGNKPDIIITNKLCYDDTLTRPTCESNVLLLDHECEKWQIWQNLFELTSLGLTQLSSIKVYFRLNFFVKSSDTADIESFNWKYKVRPFKNQPDF